MPPRYLTMDEDDLIITLWWHGPRPPGDPDEMDRRVLEDIRRYTNGIKKPSDLVTHTVFLGDDYDGPSVAVWGRPGDDGHYHCEYCEKTQWVSMKDVGGSGS